jgi:hypothetical protein
MNTRLLGLEMWSLLACIVACTACGSSDDSSAEPGGAGGSGSSSSGGASAGGSAGSGTGSTGSGGSSGGGGTSGSSGSGGVAGTIGFGPGKLSGMPFLSGHWVNGDDDKDKIFAEWRGFATDAVTQSMRGMSQWYENGGASSQSELDAALVAPVASFTPPLKGIFKNLGWQAHVWGDYPATEHRKKLIHLAWMDVVPNAIGNHSGDNPKVWYDIGNGSGDEAMFVLGRSFAWLDEKYGDPAERMSFDFAYEWTLVTHSSWPSGTYVVNGTTRETYKDFPRGWSRMVRVFREGYEHQRGKACDYRFFWRPQLYFSVRDKDNQIVRHEQLWPNLAASETIAEDVKISGVTVLPKGPLGAQANGVAVSWHDSSSERVVGSSETDAGNNWQDIVDGFPTHWGLGEALDFARQEGVPFAFPEWGARPPDYPPISPNPGDVYRFTHWLIMKNLDVLGYETVFDSSGANFLNTWDPPQPADQEPATVYKSLWKP